MASDEDDSVGMGSDRAEEDDVASIRTMENNSSQLSDGEPGADETTDMESKDEDGLNMDTPLTHSYSSIPHSPPQHVLNDLMVSSPIMETLLCSVNRFQESLVALGKNDDTSFMAVSALEVSPPDHPS
ncbi:hypothetical protein Sjap_006569 [Stephania japonica]|uniref:Uncharacterized protein n=1 Tax=Stephania japonica TaxID=461633 RepID=A0AAP0PMX7_9MAGN